MSVGRICTREVDFADPDESAWEVAERMHQRAVGTLVILDDDKKPIGIDTDRNLVERVMAQGKDPNTTLVSQVMTSQPMKVKEDTPIESALSMMRSCGFRRVPVVDDDDRLTGLLSLDDILTLLAEEFTEIGELLRRQTPRAAAGL